MGLSSSDLSDSLYSIFDGMNGKETSDEDFAEKVSKAVREYFEGADGTTVDKGTVSAGAFVGKGTVDSISADHSGCKSLILTACTAMKKTGDNATLADGMSKGFMMMFNQTNIITCKVDGTASTSNSSTTFTQETAKGSIVTKSTTMYSDILSAFNDMNCEDGESMDDWMSRLSNDPNRYLSDKIAKTVTNELTTAPLTTIGQGPIVGSTGTGILS